MVPRQAWKPQKPKKRGRSLLARNQFYCTGVERERQRPRDIGKRRPRTSATYVGSDSLHRPPYDIRGRSGNGGGFVCLFAICFVVSMCNLVQFVHFVQFVSTLCSRRFDVLLHISFVCCAWLSSFACGFVHCLRRRVAGRAKLLSSCACTLG